jgi:hypothetical protein
LKCFREKEVHSFSYTRDAGNNRRNGYFSFLGKISKSGIQLIVIEFLPNYIKILSINFI